MLTVNNEQGQSVSRSCSGGLREDKAPSMNPQGFFKCIKSNVHSCKFDLSVEWKHLYGAVL